MARFVGGVDGRRQTIERDLPAGGRLAMPGDWSPLLGTDYCGRVRCVRRFACPTGLTPTTRVWLVCEGADDAARLAINGHPLGCIAGRHPRRFDITAFLAPRNELIVELEYAAEIDRATEQRGGRLDEVRLEIDDDAAEPGAGNDEPNPPNE